MKIKQILHYLFLAGLTFIPVSGYALTAEKIQTISVQGENLRAEIPLAHIKILGIKNLDVSVASMLSYKRFRVKYESINKSLRLAVKRRKDRDYYVLVTSSEPIKQSSLNLLLRLKQGTVISYRLYELRLAAGVAHGGKLKIVAPVEEIVVAAKKPLPVIAAQRPVEVISKKPVSQKPVEVKSSAKSEAPKTVAKSTTKSEPKSAAKLSNGARPDEMVSNEAAPDEPASDESSQASSSLESYHVDLRADEELEVPGDPGELVVWIGDKSFKPAEEAGKASAQTTIAAVGQTAKVVPFAPTFKVEPAEFVCMKVHPTGSEAVFSLTPLKTGDHEIGATVHMYESDDCTGAAVPKSVKKLLVTVRVGTGEIIEGYGLQLWDKFWEELLKFWGLILATFFGLLLFLARKKLKKLFGYEEKPA